MNATMDKSAGSQDRGNTGAAACSADGMKATADISVVLVSYNTAHLLDECLGALRAAAQGLHLQVIVVDNASRDDSVQVLRARHADVELITNRVNCGFGRANNQALTLVHAPLVLLLNTDAFVAPDALQQAFAFIHSRPDVGIVGGRLVGRDGVLQPSCRFFPTPRNQFALATGLRRLMGNPRPVDDLDWDPDQPRDCDWVPGCFYLVRRALIDRVGLFDARYFLYLEEVDHCRAARKDGWKVAYCPGVRVVHIGGESARMDGPISAVGRQVSVLQMESELLYYRKWHGMGGVLLHLGLSLLGIGLVAMKRAVVPRPSAGLRSLRVRAWLWLQLASRTALGARGTR